MLKRASYSRKIERNEIMFHCTHQQKSFGRNQAERCWPGAGGGHSMFCMCGGARATLVAQKMGSPWFCLICGAKARCGKETFLLKALLVTFVATKVTAPRQERSNFVSTDQSLSVSAGSVAGNHAATHKFSWKIPANE